MQAPNRDDGSTAGTGPDGGVVGPFARAQAFPILILILTLLTVPFLIFGDDGLQRVDRLEAELTQIRRENGKLKAVLVWEDDTHVLAAGGTIPDTAWKVLSVSKTQVVMLYGDEQVVLSIGQGVKK